MTQSKLFDLMMALSDTALDNGLPATARRLEDALDAFLAETGQAPVIQAPAAPSGIAFRAVEAREGARRRLAS